ncbi:hypothetical protein UP17_12110 [Peribacillus simplex]|nr:hypothetical protein UP17_12110 [Peribacillus simplex]
MTNIVSFLFLKIGYARVSAKDQNLELKTDISSLISKVEKILTGLYIKRFHDLIVGNLEVWVMLEN